MHLTPPAIQIELDHSLPRLGKMLDLTYPRQTCSTYIEFLSYLEHFEIPVKITFPIIMVA